MTRSNRHAMAAAIVFALLIGVGIVVYLPPYEKIIYSKSNVYEYEELEGDSYGYEGCRGGASVPVVDATDESQELEIDPDKYFVLKIDVDNLKPLGIYCPASYQAAYTEYETSAFKVFFLRMGESYAQYYMASFANGKRIPVLLNDRMIRLPKSGKVLLPIGRTGIDSNLSKMNAEDTTGQWCIDAVSGFESSYEMKKFRELRTMTAVGLWIVACVAVMIIMLMIRVRRGNSK